MHICSTKQRRIFIYFFIHSIFLYAINFINIFYERFGSYLINYKTFLLQTLVKLFRFHHFPIMYLDTDRFIYLSNYVNCIVDILLTIYFHLFTCAFLRMIIYLHIYRLVILLAIFENFCT